jgi:D-glycero-D-manno-heptose 1,7-bisphosphate phosphatase
MTHTAAHKKAVFLDRDGVINVKLPENRYVRNSSEFEFLPGVAEALSMLREIGFRLVIITNQRGIARGLMSPEELERVHRFMEEELGKSSVEIDGLYYCPHDDHEYCECRKPEPGMILAACRDLGIDPAESYMVGDSASDVDAGRRAGTRTVRIAADHDPNADMVFPSLPAFVAFLQHRARKRVPSLADSSGELQE